MKLPKDIHALQAAKLNMQSAQGVTSIVHCAGRIGKSSVDKEPPGSSISQANGQHAEASCRSKKQKGEPSQSTSMEVTLPFAPGTPDLKEARGGVYEGGDSLIILSR